MRKTIFFSFILIVFLSCNKQTSNKLKDSKNDSINNNSTVNDVAFTKEKDSIFDVIKAFEDCHFEEFIKNPKTPELAKNVYLDKEWNLENDQKSLALLDSLISNNASSRLFYFKVITKISKKSDGYFSEGMALAAKKFVENYPKEFISYFENKDCFSDKDLETWAKIVSDEFKIIEERKQQKKAISTYIFELKENCKDCSETYLYTMNKFIRLLNENFN